MQTTYNQVLQEAQKLAPHEQLRLLEALASILRSQIEPPKKRSLMELKGLGKEVWEGIDAQKYVDEERASWNG